MEERIAQIGIVVEKSTSITELNQILHDYAEFIVGRMGVPYREKGISIISIIVDAPSDVVSSLSGKIGMLQDITSKTLYAKVSDETK
jgi:putative iron-only hydrogenase system regulator